MSIRARLTLWYSGILVLVLLLFGSTLYGILRKSLLAGTDRTLAETAHEVQASVRRQIAVRFPFDWEEVITIPPLDIFAAPDVFVQVRAPSGEVVATSANLRGRYLPPLPPEAEARVRAGRVDLHTVQAETAGLRLRSESIRANGQLVGILQVAVPLHPVDEALQHLLAVLLASGGLGLLLAVSGGALLSRWALAPIARITERARQIAATKDLEERIPGPAQQDEVGRLVNTFNEMLDRLQQLFQGQQRFIADLSHELRTPLAAIQGNLEVLQRGAQADPDLLEESLPDIQREVARLSRMVADLLVLARADAGVHLESRPVELDRLLLEVYREARHLSRGVEVRLGSEDQVAVPGDVDRLKQLLLNLVSNALKYTPAGGTVTLSLYQEGPWACLSVADTGVGIPAEELPHIFERFYRGKGTSRRSGMGLGLSIAHWIAQEHDGQITVESEEGKGSTFTIWLPQTSQEEMRQNVV